MIDKVEAMTSLVMPGGGYLDTVRAVIAFNGWAVQHIHEPGHDIAHAYTVGLTGLGGPEILVCGLEPPESAALLNLVAPLILSGQMAIGSHFLAPVGATTRPAHTVIHDGGLALVATALYGAAVRCAEIVLA